jgi:hypothetical protein
MKQRWEKRRQLRELLAARTGCGIQYTGWPCNRCYHTLHLSNVNDEELHAMWIATLVLRGDYKDGDYGIHMPDEYLGVLIDRLLVALHRVH